jgi:hypothetical protein
METYTDPLHGNITTDVKKKKGGGRESATNGQSKMLKPRRSGRFKTE